MKSAASDTRKTRILYATALVLILILGVSLAGCGYRDVPAAPPSTQYGYPVLTELSPITLDDVTLIEIQGSPANGGGPIIPLRTLSPAADRELVERLLAAYGKALLDPGAGFPTREGFRRLYSLAIYCRGEREVWIDVTAEGDRVVVAEIVGGLPVAGQESNPPQTYGTAPNDFREGEVTNPPQAYGSGRELADLSRTLAAEEPASDFGPGRAGLPETMPADFGFVLAFGVAARNVLDTFAGTFTKDMIVDPPVTTELRLSPEELARLYRRMAEIKIEAYPRDFRPADTGEGFGSPYSSYRLRLRADGRELAISWEDLNSSSAPEATGLRQLFQDIRLMIEARDEYKRLPAARGGYM